VAELSAGIYERLITQRLTAELTRLAPGLRAERGAPDPALVPDRIAWHLGQEIERALRDVPDERRLAVGAAVARSLLERLADGLAGHATVDLGQIPAAPVELLRAVHRLDPTGTPVDVPGPLTPLLDTTLLTNARGEPRLVSQLASEIASADRIDVIMAFIRRSGIRPLLEPLRRHVAERRPLRILTTTYTGSTERAALDELAALGAEVRVSYDQGTTRLHAKSWIFHRDNGFSTAYVGSSNLTHAAQVDGLEWNVRVSAARNPDVVDKFDAVFEAYWSSDEFAPYRADEFQAELERLGREQRAVEFLLPPTELHARPFQARLLELLEVSRRRGHHRNLLVAATGTGKTVMAALDYATLRARLPRARLLFVAHRAEILEQSRATFRHALREASFGELWVGGNRPTRFEHVFASIQSLDAADLDALAADHFDVVIVDEFHHAAAPTYDRVLGRLFPVELVGLTATPERADGASILHWFDDRIAAELRLWDAIDQQLLAPFQYYGVHDGLDLRTVPWRRGRGYDSEALTNVFTGNDAWARLVIAEVRRHTDVASMRALGFCVSVEHARFLARHFAAAGIRAVAVWGATPADERREALDRLRRGEIQVVFSVDLFNEGVDVPAVDTVLLLRPSESATLFMQQLGRGLRRTAGKTVCTVLDFVGEHRAEFRFDLRLRALLGGSRTDVTKAVERGFPYLPAGCHLELDPVAQQIVLRSLRNAIPGQWPKKVAELRSLAAAKGEFTLARFLQESGLDLDDVYDGTHGWSDLRADAGLGVRAPGPHEPALRRAIGRLLHLDDAVRLGTYRTFLERDEPPAVTSLSAHDRRLLHLLVASVANGVVPKGATLADAAALVWRHPQVRAEILELLDALDTRVDHLHIPLASHPDCPLQIHARYTRVEILAGFGLTSEAKVPSWQSGVYDAKAAGADLFAVTLDKSAGTFSPKTRYRDHAVNRTLFHWESQSTTRADSPTGQRYQHHERLGRSVFLFTRLSTDHRAFWFLGPARYRRHVGERPMAITWELHHPLPGDLYEQFAAVPVAAA
jgi:superfamily II DNA or RNA helicase/HKD family nuclease